MHKLVIQDDEGKTTVVPLIRDELTIGRKEGNTIRLTERNVSRRHARLLRTNGTISIEDLNSYNGIRVNGTRIQGRASINESDRVQIGDYLIEIKAEVDEQDKLDQVRTHPHPRDAAAPEPPTAADVSEQETHRVIERPAAPAKPEKPRDPDEQAMALENTDPAGLAVQLQPEVPARLVALSSLFAGREFTLDRASVVIGRTEDNDLSLNHRSISRHHAQVVREGARYFIVDLQSSNGVRVNGEDYGRVELRRGDVVDLGHVRLRFVEPGEDFVFGRDAQSVEMEDRGWRPTVWAALALLLVGALAVVLMTRNDGAAPDAVPVTLAPPDGMTPQGVRVEAPVVVPTPPSIKDAGVAGAVAAVGADVQHRLEQGRQALAAEDWRLAVEQARSVQSIDPQNDDARALAEQATLEIAQATLFADLERAARAGQQARAREIFGKLASESVYRAKALPLLDELRDAYLTTQREAGARLAARGRCREQARLANEAERVGGAEARAAVLASTCKAPAGASPGGASPAGAPAPVPITPEVPPSEPAADTAVSSDEILSEARQAAKDGLFNKALKLCQGALARRPGDSEAAQICVIASCNLKSSAMAKRYLDKIKTANRIQALRQICSSKGVEIE